MNTKLGGHPGAQLCPPEENIFGMTWPNNRTMVAQCQWLPLQSRTTRRLCYKVVEFSRIVALFVVEIFLFKIQCDENLRATVLYDLPPSYLVTTGVDQLLEHLPVDLAGPGRVGRSRGRARLVGERHEGPADLAQGILVVVELLRGSELLLPAGRVFAAFAVGAPAALCARTAPVQGLAHQLGRLL